MAETVQTSEVVTESQQAFVDDYFNDGNFELVNDDGSPIVSEQQPKNAEEAKTETQNKKPDQQAQQPAQPAATEKPAEQQTAAQKRLEIEAGLYDETGNLKDDAFDFLGIGKEGWEYTPPTDPKLEGQQQQNVPEWKQYMEEEKVYKTNLQENYLSIPRRIQELKAQGYDTDTALQYAVGEAQQILSEHFAQREAESRERLFQKQQEEFAKVTETERLRSTATANQMELANKVGGIEKFHQIMFSPEIGGPVINWLFDQLNPDKATIPREQIAKEISQWWTRFSSNKQNLNFAFNMSMAQLQKRMYPDIVKRVRANAQAQQKHNTEGAAKAPGRLQAHRAAPPKAEQGSDDLDKYLSTDFNLDEV